MKLPYGSLGEFAGFTTGVAISLAMLRFALGYAPESFRTQLRI